MGATQSQEIQNFLNNYVNTTVVQQVIQRYASETNAVVNGRQNLKIVINANTISGTSITANQRITSYIDVEQMISRSNDTSLTNDLQTAVTNTLENALDRYVDSIAGFLSSSSNQQLVNNIRNSISTYVSQTINTSTVDNLLLSSSNVQEGVLEVNAENIQGSTLVWNQDIQASIMAKNIIEDVVNTSFSNTQVQELANATKNQVVSKETNPISDVVRAGANLLNPRSIILIAALVIGIIIAILGVVLAFSVPMTPKMKMISIGVGVGLGVVVALGGIIYYAVSKPKTA